MFKRLFNYLHEYRLKKKVDGYDEYITNHFTGKKTKLNSWYIGKLDPTKVNTVDPDQLFKDDQKFNDDHRSDGI